MNRKKRVENQNGNRWADRVIGSVLCGILMVLCCSACSLQHSDGTSGDNQVDDEYISGVQNQTIQLDTDQKSDSNRSVHSDTDQKSDTNWRIQSDTDQTTQLDTDQTTQLDTDQTTQSDEAPIIKKQYSLETLEHVLQLSEEDLVEIAMNAYCATDFVKDLATIEYFEIEMDTELYEKIMPEYIGSKEFSEEQDSDTASIQYREAAQEYMQYLLDVWTTMEPGDDTGAKATESHMIFCGENEHYIEYTLRYVDERWLYENNELTCHRIPRAYRMVFYKNVEKVAEKNYDILYGTLSSEYVQTELDLLLRLAESPVVYREVTENEEAYLYTGYEVRYCYGDPMVNDEVELNRFTYSVNKADGHVTWEYPEVIKSYELMGTARDYQDFVDEGVYE